VPVVVLDHVARRRGAGDDGAAALGDEHRRPWSSDRVLEDDVGIVADERADLLAQATPFASSWVCSSDQNW
jgi:hypothetical protein